MITIKKPVKKPRAFWSRGEYDEWLAAVPKADVEKPKGRDWAVVHRADGSASDQALDRKVDEIVYDGVTYVRFTVHTAESFDPDFEDIRDCWDGGGWGS